MTKVFLILIFSFSAAAQERTCEELLAENWASEMLASGHVRLSQLTQSQMAQVSLDVVTKGEAVIDEKLRFKDKVVSTYIDRDGRVFLKLVEPTKSRSLSGMTTSTYLPMDVHTQAVDANFDSGRRLVQSMVEEADRGVAVIFIDVNYLGRVNYFAAGQAAGDEYLEAVALAVRSCLRDDDLIFKTGGDELVVILDTDKAEVAQGVAQRIVDEVYYSPLARRIFHDQSVALAAEYRTIREASSPDQLTVGAIANLSLTDLELARSDFSQFRKRYLDILARRLHQHAAFRPSVSIGTSITSPGVPFEDAKRAAESQAAMVKIEYKQNLGQDVSKYERTRLSDLGERRKGRIKPMVQLPILLQPKSSQ